eukprot:TRINITY_DN19066_c0_g1_i1.p1 TRINITY_DN19066_c0_g1~~TRINITY_DN19066_c0_g1_i1.p1  ORF type:complete len:297 (+),score=36.30 TRINITY_DN19066_c0_g1_i1:32-892(+)
MASVVSAVSANILAGMRDSCNVGMLLRAAFKSERLGQLCLQCLLLNGLVVCGSAFVFYQLDWLAATYLPVVSGSSTATSVFGVLSNIVYQCIWHIPLQLLCHVLNYMWYTYIFEEGVRVALLRVPVKAFTYRRWLRLVSNEVLKLLLIALFALQANLIELISFCYIGPICSFFMFCLLHSFFTFDYCWGQQEWSLKAKIDHFEVNWDYFLGFGLPMTAMYYALCYGFSTFLAYGVTSLLYPAHIILSLCCRPPGPPVVRLAVFHTTISCLNLVTPLIPRASTKQQQ